MKTPTELTAQVRARYWATWRDWLIDPPAGPIRFPLGAPSANSIARNMNAVDTWWREWREWHTSHQQVMLRSSTKRTPVGHQEIITHLEAPTIEALLTVEDALLQHWEIARSRWEQVTELGSPAAVVKPHLKQIVDLPASDFNLLIAAARWFSDNPRSGLMPRQVPVAGMHTKWLARHRRFVLALLGHSRSQDNPSATRVDDARAPGQLPEHHALAPDHDMHTEPDDQGPDDWAEEITQDDLDLLGLRTPPTEVDIILADATDRALLAGLRHVRAPIREIAALPLHLSTVLIIENKESALLIPDHPNLVVIHSLGNHLDALAQLPWLATASRLLYWGDLDRPGITLLSRARAVQPRIRSVLMDTNTVETYMHLAVAERITRVDPPIDNLRPHERAALDALTGSLDGDHAQLEQERLPAPVVIDRIAEALRCPAPESEDSS